ncbi:MAG: GxxExxY protein [Planctomycetota bacterium]|jgi:GxxExxY protein
MTTTERRTTRTEDLDPELTEVSRKVIGASIEVHRTLGPGLSLEIYRAALQHELREEGVEFACGHRVPVEYKGSIVGELELDMFVNNRFTVQLMNERREIDGLDRTSLRARLRASNLELGLIINFAERRLKDGLVRVLNPDMLPEQEPES